MYMGHDHSKKLSWHLIKSAWRRIVSSGNIYGGPSIKGNIGKDFQVSMFIPHKS